MQQIYWILSCMQMILTYDLTYDLTHQDISYLLAILARRIFNQKESIDSLFQTNCH